MYGAYGRLVLLRQKLCVSRASGARPGTQGQHSRTHSLSPLGPGSRSGCASASAGTRKACDAVELVNALGAKDPAARGGRFDCETSLSAEPRSPGGGRLALGPSRDDVHDLEIALLELLEE